MFSTGLTSITFRKLPANEIIDLVVRAGLDGIEWGGDVHVPPGDERLAREVGVATRDAGLCILSYGSYFRCTAEESDGISPLLATAAVLGAPVVRVWAGRKGSADASREDRDEVAAVLRSLVEQAASQGTTVALEYHGETLTDTMESAHQLLEEVGDERLRLYWQPRTGGNPERDLTELRAALPRLAHLHAFQWSTTADGNIVRHPLQAGFEIWSRYLEVASHAGGDRAVILEFVAGDEPEQFLSDASVLLRLAAQANSHSQDGTP